MARNRSPSQPAVSNHATRETPPVVSPGASVERVMSLVPSRRTWLAILAASTMIAFSSALRAPFVFDDLPGIRANASIRQLLPLSQPLRPPPNTSVSGRPVVNLSLAVNYAINELLGVDQRGPAATVGYHVANVLIHLLCGVLLFTVVRRTLDRWWREPDGRDPTLVAAAAALLWSLHPIQTQAVDYVIARTELIVSAFYLATLYASIRAWDSGNSARRWWYLAAVAACALGMASKEVMFSAPLIVALYDRAFRVGSWRELARNRQRLAFYTTLGVVAVVAAFVAVNARKQSVGFDLGVRWYEYAYSQAWAVAHYLRLLVVPIGLTFDYGQNPITGYRGVLGILALTGCALATLAAWTRPRWIWLGFLGAWFFIILAPSSSIVPIRTEIAAERRVYLASAAVFVLAVVALAQLSRRMRWSRRSELIGVGALAFVLGVATYVRGLTYGSAERLYRDVVAKAPGNARAYVALGTAMFESTTPRFEEATATVRQATVVDSTYAVGWHALGVLQFAQGQMREATQSFERVLRLEPDQMDATRGMARALLALGEIDAAIPYVVRLGGSDADVLWSLGSFLVARGRGPEAIRYIEPLASRNPPAVGIALLSAAYAQSARVSDAVQAAQAATARAGDTARVFEIAGRAMLIARRPRDAEAYLRRALALDPTSVSVQRALDQFGSQRR